MNKVKFILALLSIGLMSCSEINENLEEKETVVTITGYKDGDGNLQWVNEENGQQIEILPESDSLKMPDSLRKEGYAIEFTGHYFKKNQPFVLNGDTLMYKTILYSKYVLKSKKDIKKSVDDIPTTVLPFSKIDTNNFFKTFAAYVQNGNIYELTYFYDSIYYQRRCIEALENDTAKCMNEQFCGVLISKDGEGKTKACLDFNDIGDIEFTGFDILMDEKVATFKITSASDGRKIKLQMMFRKVVKNGKTTYGIVGVN